METSSDQLPGIPKRLARNPLENQLTARMSLARVTQDDLDDFIAFYDHPEVTATLGGRRDPNWVAAYLHQQMAHWDQYGFGFWTMRELATGRFMGRGGLRHATIEGQVVIEVGYGLLSEFWNRGLATELAQKSVRIGFEELRFEELVSFTLTTNLASRRVMEKAGLQYVRDIVYADLPHLFFRRRNPALRTEGP